MGFSLRGFDPAEMPYVLSNAASFRVFVALRSESSPCPSKD
jgi:hypothetical protein